MRDPLSGQRIGHREGRTPRNAQAGVGLVHSATLPVTDNASRRQDDASLVLGTVSGRVHGRFIANVGRILRVPCPYFECDLSGGNSRSCNNNVFKGIGVSSAGRIVAGTGGRCWHRAPSRGPVAVLTKRALNFFHVRGHEGGGRLAGLVTIAEWQRHGNDNGRWGGVARIVAAGTAWRWGPASRGQRWVACVQVLVGTKRGAKVSSDHATRPLSHPPICDRLATPLAFCGLSPHVATRRESVPRRLTRSENKRVGPQRTLLCGSSPARKRPGRAAARVSQANIGGFVCSALEICSAAIFLQTINNLAARPPASAKQK